MSRDDSARISPTAHYTGYLWFRHGLSHPALITRGGALLYHGARPMSRLYQALAQRSLEAVLLARHRAIDRLLADAIEAGEVTQILEIAAGLSPRGFRFGQRYRDAGLVYVESDLPAMAARKRRALDAAGLRGPNHHVVAVDALARTGPASLAAATAGLLDPGRGTAIITEGLLPYLDEPAQQDLWRRCAGHLRGFRHGLYLSDLYLSDDIGNGRLTRLLRRLVEHFVRGRLSLPFRNEDEAAAALVQAGFRHARIHHPADLDPDRGRAARDRRPVVRVVAARTAGGRDPIQQSASPP